MKYCKEHICNTACICVLIFCVVELLHFGYSAGICDHSKNLYQLITNTSIIQFTRNTPSFEITYFNATSIEQKQFYVQWKVQSISEIHWDDDEDYYSYDIDSLVFDVYCNVDPANDTNSDITFSSLLPNNATIQFDYSLLAHEEQVQLDSTNIFNLGQYSFILHIGIFNWTSKWSLGRPMIKSVLSTSQSIFDLSAEYYNDTNAIKEITIHAPLSLILLHVSQKSNVTVYGPNDTVSWHEGRVWLKTKELGWSPPTGYLGIELPSGYNSTEFSYVTAVEFKPPNFSDGNNLLIIIVIVGVVLLFIVIAVIIFCLVKRKTNSDSSATTKQEQSTDSNTNDKDESKPLLIQHS